MAEPDSNEPTAAFLSRGQTPLVTLALVMAAMMGVLNLSNRQGTGQAPTSAGAGRSAANPATSGSPPRAGVADALETLEPLQRFLDLKEPPTTLEQMAAALDGYRLTTLIATLSDPRDSRLGYDFDTAIEAIQRAIESEGYVLDRFRLPWTDQAFATAQPVSGQPAPTPAQVAPPGRSAPSPTATPNGAAGTRHERQPGSILFRIDRVRSDSGPQPPQDLLLLLLVGETPTWGVQQEAMAVSLDIARTLDYDRKEKVSDTDHETAIRILGPTFSGTSDSLSRVIRNWAGASPDRKGTRIWVCTGAATALGKSGFERNCEPAELTFASTVIPDEVLLAELHRYLGDPTGRVDPAQPVAPGGKVALLVEGGSGYGSAVASEYGTSGRTDRSKATISIPFPLHIAELRGEPGDGSQARNRVAIPFDPPSGRQSDHLPSLSPRMTVATNNLIVANILSTIAKEQIRHVGIVATDILDVMYLTRLVRENCPDVQVFLVGSDLRYTDPQFTLDFRGTVIASSYPLDPRAQLWSYPFHGDVVRRLFPNEFDIGRYNAGLVLLNASTDQDHARRLVIDADRGEDLIAYGKPFVASFFDSFNRRPVVWINQVGQTNVWPLKVVSLNQTAPELRSKAEELLPPVVHLDPHAEKVVELQVDWDFPLTWKLAVCSTSFLAFLLVSLILSTRFGDPAAGSASLSWFSPILSRLDLARPDVSRRNVFFIMVLVVSLVVPYCGLVAPLDVLRPAQSALDGERDALLRFGWDAPVLAALAGLTLIWFAVPLGLGLREVIRRRPSTSMGSTPSAGERDRWLDAESQVYRTLTALVVLAGVTCILHRFFSFAWRRTNMPNDWLQLERGSHLMGGISPILPIVCLGLAYAWLAYLEIKRMHGHPFLRRGQEMIPARLIAGTPGAIEWRRPIWMLNARHRLCIDLLEYPMTVLISRNLPLAAIAVSALIGLATFLWGVIWPRYIPTPEGRIFDGFVMLALSGYLLFLLYTLVRYAWLWRSIFQLLRQATLLPLASVFDRVPPRVAARFTRFHRISIREVADLQIPLQQCRVVAMTAPATSSDSCITDAVSRVRAVSSPSTGWERIDAVSEAALAPVLELVWSRRSIDAAFSGQTIQPQADVDESGPISGDAIARSDLRWLDDVEDLLVLRIVYLLCQFAVPVRCLSQQLIYGPIILLMAVSWYPFYPQHLMSIILWIFIVAGVAATLGTFIQLERSELVTRLSRRAPNTLKFDQAFLSNMVPYLVPLAGFIFTAFPSLTYWLGSIFEPIGRALK